MGIHFLCKFIDKWTKIITVTKDEIIQSISHSFYNLTGEMIDAETIAGFQNALDALSFSCEAFIYQKSINLKDTPLLKVGQDKYILLGNNYLVSALPYRCEKALNKCKVYRENKGKLFEKIVLKLFTSTYGSNFHQNIKYGSYELDGLLNLSHTSWFIECSSHPPNISSEFSDEVKLFDDFRKSVIKCQDQGKRAIEHAADDEYKNSSLKEKKGIIVIIDEHYPNISDAEYKYFEEIGKSINKSLPEQFKNQIPKIEYPRYVINYFELETIIEQPDAYLFEEFLEWRTQDNMPISCSDELDYWDYFTKMLNDKQREKEFRICQERHHIIQYIGNRFNNKSYLNKIIEKESKENK